MPLLSSSLEARCFFFPFTFIEWHLLERKGFGELEEKVNSQNKNGHRKMNQKDLSLFVNFPKKIRIMILDQNLQFLSEEKLQKQPFWVDL